jgi:hypothetical protein
MPDEIARWFEQPSDHENLGDRFGPGDRKGCCGQVVTAANTTQRAATLAAAGCNFASVSRIVVRRVRLGRSGDSSVGSSTPEDDPPTNGSNRADGDQNDGPDDDGRLPRTLLRGRSL